jgi:hypothetical protein
MEIDLREGETRERIEKLRWKLAQDLLALESGHRVGKRGKVGAGKPFGSEREPLAPLWNFKPARSGGRALRQNWPAEQGVAFRQAGVIRPGRSANVCVSSSSGKQEVLERASRDH